MSETPAQARLDDEGRPIRPGDLVIQLGKDGVPSIWTEPEDDESPAS